MRRLPVRAGKPACSAPALCSSSRRGFSGGPAPRRIGAWQGCPAGQHIGDPEDEHEPTLSHTHSTEPEKWYEACAGAPGTRWRSFRTSSSFAPSAAAQFPVHADLELAVRGVFHSAFTAVSAGGRRSCRVFGTCMLIANCIGFLIHGSFAVGGRMLRGWLCRQSSGVISLYYCVVSVVVRIRRPMARVHDARMARCEALHAVGPGRHRAAAAQRFHLGDPGFDLSYARAARSCRGGVPGRACARRVRRAAVSHRPLQVARSAGGAAFSVQHARQRDQP